MENRLRASGFLFAIVFAAGYVLSFVIVLTRGDGLFAAFFHPSQILSLVSVALFLLSALFPPLRWLQPAIFLLTSPVAIVPDSHNIYGLGYFIMGVVLLERAGFFLKHRPAKVVILLAYLLAIEVVAVFISKENIGRAISPTFFIAAFGLFLWFLYKDRLVVILKEPKPRIALSEKGLSPAERTYVFAMIEGKSVKEIAFEYEVAESTVRNTITRACKKLEVEDTTGLAVLAATHEVVA